MTGATLVKKSETENEWKKASFEHISRPATHPAMTCRTENASATNVNPAMSTGHVVRTARRAPQNIPRSAKPTM